MTGLPLDGSLKVIRQTARRLAMGFKLLQIADDLTSSSAIMLANRLLEMMPMPATDLVRYKVEAYQ